MTPGEPGHVPSPHPDLSLRRILELGVVGLASDLRDQRIGRQPRRQGTGRSIRQRVDARLRRPIFIVGAPRSGTTFLGSCIGSLPDVSYHFEPRLTKAAARCIYDGSWSEAKGGRIFKAMYAALLIGSGHGGLRFAEKNPENCFILPFLHRQFPDATFVHILRDGRDATVSHAEKPWLAAESAASAQRGRGGTAWGPEPRFWVERDRREEFRSVSDIARSAWCWRRFTEAALAALVTLPADRVLTVRYESMVLDPLASALQLADFLGVKTDSDRDVLRSALLAASPASVGRWRRALSARDLAEVQQQCDALLTQLGFTA